MRACHRGRSLTWSSCPGLTAPRAALGSLRSSQGGCLRLVREATSRFGVGGGPWLWWVGLPDAGRRISASNRGLGVV